eukprot:gnl/MRDRNA2_/MRDRNA2_73047_c0_seq2.p1 gnl/MRDRNA2_/MRDRNA2_73047_c0~~gnl/MRDRNA2_/MRDRNA2_73047_c0_seq2.p1  ORF type:complete len:191 (-),score=23.19 gnl/MRDRNA2_/MRDRNA2_73047_c0_seq2:319-891(-)
MMPCINLCFILAMVFLTMPGQGARVKRRSSENVTHNGEAEELGNRTQEEDAGLVLKNDDGLPPGLYQDSCSGCKILGDTVLYCDQCKDRDGGQKPASIPLAGCKAFTNDNGGLKCLPDDWVPPYASVPGVLPPGPYKELCSGCQNFGPVLYCKDCKGRGEFSIHTSKCPDGAFELVIKGVGADNPYLWCA